MAGACVGDRRLQSTTIGRTACDTSKPDGTATRSHSLSTFAWRDAVVVSCEMNDLAPSRVSVINGWSWWPQLTTHSVNQCYRLSPTTLAAAATHKAFIDDDDDDHDDGYKRLLWSHVGESFVSEQQPAGIEWSAQRRCRVDGAPCKIQRRRN